MQYDLLACEQQIDLFERQVSGLWVEEPDQWQEGEVENCKVNVCPPLDVIDRDGSDLHYQKCKDPIRSCC